MSSAEKSNADISPTGGMAMEDKEVIFVGEQNRVYGVHDRILILSGG
jgi:hypothetical protein